MCTKEELDTRFRESSKFSSDSAKAITSAIRLGGEEQMKKIDSLLASKKWKDALVTQLSTQLSSQLTEALSAELGQSVGTRVQNTVRDTVKGGLTSSFRTAFENTLLPAFQAGTDRMFAQVQGSFEVGMEGLAEQSRGSEAVIASLHGEVMQLRATVSRLESQLNEIQASVASAAASHASSSSVGIAAVHVDPMKLLDMGRVAEALEATLEQKDVTLLVTLLSRMASVSQLTDTCSRLHLLCATQQLAVDLAKNTPQEGLPRRLEWIKNLVMHLISAAPDEEAAMHIKPVLTLVGESLNAAQARLLTEASDGSGVDAAGLSSTVTDLRMLQLIVGSQI